MPAVARVSVDNTIGTNIGAQNSTVYCNGSLVQLLGDSIAPHWLCPIVPIHCAAVHVAGSPTVFINGIPVVRVGDAASCGHADVTGSEDVFANEGA